MTTNDPHNKFLELESQANDLVESLEALKIETENYNTATGHLRDVADGINNSIEGMQTASKGIVETVQKLNEIGTPEILASLQSLTSLVTEIQSRLGSVETKLQTIDQQSKRSLFVRLLTFK